MEIRISDKWLSSPSNAAVRNWLIGSIVLAAVGYTAVTLAFIRAEFPGTLFQAQLAFRGETIKAQYATLIQQGTFGAYITAQIIDYAWIFGLMLTLFFAHVAITRAQTNPGWRNLALSLAVIAPPSLRPMPSKTWSRFSCWQTLRFFRTGWRPFTRVLHPSSGAGRSSASAY